MNQKLIYSVMLYTHHLRGLTQVDEGGQLTRGSNFTCVFPYIRNPPSLPRISSGVPAVSDFGHRCRTKYSYTKPAVTKGLNSSASAKCSRDTA